MSLFPSSEYLMNTLPEDQEPIRPGTGLEKYRDILLKVKDWNKFEESDLQRNQIEVTGNSPDFVTSFEQRLDRKPRLPKGVRVSSICHLLFDFDDQCSCPQRIC